MIASIEVLFLSVEHAHKSVDQAFTKTLSHPKNENRFMSLDFSEVSLTDVFGNADVA